MLNSPATPTCANSPPVMMLPLVLGAGPKSIRLSRRVVDTGVRARGTLLGSETTWATSGVAAAGAGTMVTIAAASKVSRRHTRSWGSSAGRQRRGGLSVRALANSSVAFQDEEVASAPSRPVRVRFAPSPTGVLHVGGARTALFNWLFAKSQAGEMVLRIEDTDVARSTAESEAAILEGLKWCGLNWDEGPDVGGDYGPYRQSERIRAGVYQEQLDTLMAGGHAYRCFLSPEELDEMRAEAERNEQAFVVDSPWASATQEKIQEMLDKGAPYVYRFRVPPDEDIVLDDLVLGEVEWNSDDLGGDFVIVRQNGMPMYNFGVVVDDAQMNISHVFRAQEHLMNTPRQVFIYKALGLEPPTFGHMPLILAPDRSKLSKRHGAVAIGDYQKQGYLPDGMVNYLSQLGWNDGTNKEIYSPEQLVGNFTMERMSKVAAIFDKDKFKWVNAHHVRLLDDETAERLIGAELVGNKIVKDASGDFVRKAAILLRERISVLTEAATELRSIMAYDIDAMLESEVAREHHESGSIRETAQCLVAAHSSGAMNYIGKDPNVVKDLAKLISEERGGVKKKALIVPYRFCLTASDHGPAMNILFDLLDSVDDNVLCDVVPLDSRINLLYEKVLNDAYPFWQPDWQQH